MKVMRNSKVETEVRWIATIEIEQDELNELTDVLGQAIMDVGNNELADELHKWRQRLTYGMPEPDGPKRPITEIKRKANK